jgi:type II secretory pathway component GspD/PulD (secretin)
MNRVLSLSWAQGFCVLLILGWGAGLAAEPNAVGEEPVVASNDGTADANLAEVDPTSGRTEFIRFQKDSNIRQALSLLEKQWKKNIVPSTAVDGPVTVTTLYNVTFEEALEAILGYGFKSIQKGDSIWIYTVEQYKKIQENPERMISKVIPLHYITAEEAVKLVTPVMSGAPTAKVQATSPAQNTISSSSGNSGLSSSGGGNDLATNDMIVVYDFPESIERVEEVLRELDVRPKQVLIEATILTANLTEDMEFGIDWNLLTGTPITAYPALINGYGTKAQTAGFGRTPGSKGLTVGLSADNVQAIITALETVTDTTVLANPKILAVNKQEGSLLIGRKLGYQDTTTTTLTGGTTASIAFLETGTRLAFRPYIGHDGYIRMDIYPKDSDGSLQQNGIPIENTTELRTNVIVKDGQTVVIGGLFRDSVTTSKSQVPLLGSLPIVGVAFRGTKDTIRREEVVIILTPHIIDEPAEVRGDDRADDIRRKRQGATDSMSNLDRSKWAEDAYARAARYYLEGDVEKAVFNVKLALLMRPTYLEALRLRERIVAETDPEQFRRLDSIVVEEVDAQQAENWQRR